MYLATEIRRENVGPWEQMYLERITEQRVFRWKWQARLWAWWRKTPGYSIDIEEFK